MFGSLRFYKRAIELCEMSFLLSLLRKMVERKHKM